MNVNKLENRKDLKDAFLEYGKQIYGYVYVRCGYSKELAEDITQDVFLKAWEKRTSYDREKSSLKNWLYIIARNTVVDYYRKNKNRKSVTLDENIFIAQNTFDRENESLMKVVLKNLLELNEKEREVLTLRYIQDLEIDEIAEILKLTKTNVKVRIHRALKKLIKHINEK